MKKIYWALGVVLVSIFAVGSVQAQTTDTEFRVRALEEKLDSLTGEDKKVNYDTHGVKSTSAIKTSYGKKGFHFETGNGLFSTNLQWRAQMRFSNPGDADPRSLTAFDGTGANGTDTNNFELRRVRMKIGGHGYQPWLKYYFELDLQPSKTVGSSSSDRTRLIDWRIDVQPWSWLGVRVGQWKVNYNRERVDSSGRQQFVERSIVNRVFTVDRQVGAMLQGRLFKGTHADMRYYGGVFNGEGRATDNFDTSMLWMGRLQWNFLGRDLKWRQSDVKRHKKPAGSLAFAAATNDSPCTRWSSSGCGNLSGFSGIDGATATDKFQTEQFVQEFAFKYKGLSLQQEYHWKNIDDHDGIDFNLQGSYAQVGYFFNELVKAVPEQLEVAFRYAFVDEPDSSALSLTNNRDEYTLGLNYFIAGHNNKVSMDVSYLTLDDASSGRFEDDIRFRMQWDISF